MVDDENAEKQSLSVSALDELFELTRLMSECTIISSYACTYVRLCETRTHTDPIKP